MKNFRKFLALVGALALIILCSSITVFAQDSTATGPQVVSTVFGIPIPAVIQTLVVAVLVILPSIQFVLKRIPTAGSVKIQGILGKVLDFLTFFQKDKIKS